jgi:tetratricopeptide (TPR) repeat protein
MFQTNPSIKQMVRNNYLNPNFFLSIFFFLHCPCITTGWVLNAQVLQSLSTVSSSDFLDPLLRAFRSEGWLPLSAYLSLCRSLLRVGRFSEALEVALRGFQSYSTSATLLLVIGVSCLRLDRLGDAENALTEATLLDSRNSEIWIFLSLMCLAYGSKRLDEAIKAFQQAARIGSDGYNNPILLRELATSFIAVDKLQIAEDLIRQAMACEVTSSTSDSGKPSAYTRKILADILAGQNQAALAVDEYQTVIRDDEIDIMTKIKAGEKCINLLVALGRHEETKVLKDILDTMEDSRNNGSQLQ